jgi:hypothetical protein
MVRRDRDLDMGVADLVALLGGSHGGGSHTMVSPFDANLILQKLNLHRPLRENSISG